MGCCPAASECMLCRWPISLGKVHWLWVLLHYTDPVSKCFTLRCASSYHIELKENGVLLLTRTYLFYQRLTVFLPCLKYNHDVDIMHTVDDARCNTLSPKRRRIDLDHEIRLHPALRQTLTSAGLEVIDRKAGKHNFLSPDFDDYSARQIIL